MIYLTMTEAVNQIGSVAEDIDKYGYETVILAVFIVIVLAIILANNTAQKRMIENIVKSNESYCEVMKKQTR